MGSQEVLNETRNSSDNNLTEGGAICHKLYEKAKYKIVHLLKEPTENNWASLAEVILAKVIRDDGTVKGQLYKVPARRSYCILKGFPSWIDIHKKENMFADALKGSAIVNLSPEPGGNSTPSERLERLAKEWKHWWYDRKLKEELKPDIVICGGTFGPAIKQIADASYKPPQVSTGMYYFVDENLGTVFLDCWHPAARFKHSFEYCYFCESCKEIIPKFVL